MTEQSKICTDPNCHTNEPQPLSNFPWRKKNIKRDTKCKACKNRKTRIRRDAESKGKIIPFADRSVEQYLLYDHAHRNDHKTRGYISVEKSKMPAENLDEGIKWLYSGKCSNTKVCHVFYFDPEDREKDFWNLGWYAVFDGKNRYVQAEIHENGKRTTLAYHKLKSGFEMTDHRDQNGLNNRWSNLLDSTPQQNDQRRRRSKNNTSGYDGIQIYKGRGSKKGEDIGYITTWHEEYSQQKKYFNKRNYGGDMEKTLEAAIEHRKKMVEINKIACGFVE